MKKLIVVLTLVLGVSVGAAAQWGPLPSDPIAAQIEQAKRNVLALKVTQAKAAQTAAARNAANCEVSKAVKAIVSFYPLTGC